MRERLESLDYLRGVAILGMLVANVPWHTGTSMSRVHQADWSSAAGWMFQYLVIDGRFMPIFCMLFGAGFLILAEGRERAPGFGLYVARRMGILFLIGLAHAYLLWPGDILLTYSICGFSLLLFYRLSAWRLLALGVAFKILHQAILQWPIIYDVAFDSWMFAWWLEIGDAPMSEARAYAGSYPDLLAYNSWRNQFIQWTAMPYYRIWNALGYMLIGMALFRWGVLQAGLQTRVYRRMFWISVLVGVPMLVYGLVGRVGGHDTLAAFFGRDQTLPHYSVALRLGSEATAFSMLAGAILIFRLDPDARWLDPIKAVGRMALTNYILHSVIFLVIFAGFNAVPYDSLDPDDRLAWSVAIWAIQLSLSPLWLKLFKQGPLEKAWRTLAGPGPERT